MGTGCSECSSQSHSHWIFKVYSFIHFFHTIKYFEPKCILRPTASNDNGQRTAKPRHYVFGVACTEVEVDCSTGDHFIVQSDLVMDIGRSLNPALDVGHIEGAFTQVKNIFIIKIITKVFIESNQRVLDW